MKFELEILDQDLKDRELIIKMRGLIEEEMDKLSGFSKNNLINQLNHLRSAIEQVENGWLRWQRDRVLNVFSNELNVDRSRFEKEWHDY